MVIGWVCVLFSAVGLLSLLGDYWYFGSFAKWLIGYYQSLKQIVFAPLRTTNIELPVGLEQLIFWLTWFALAFASSRKTAGRTAGVSVLSLLPLAILALVFFAKLNTFKEIFTTFLGPSPESIPNLEGLAPFIFIPIGMILFFPLMAFAAWAMTLFLPFFLVIMREGSIVFVDFTISCTNRTISLSRSILLQMPKSVNREDLEHFQRWWGWAAYFDYWQVHFKVVGFAIAIGLIDIVLLELKLT